MGDVLEIGNLKTQVGMKNRKLRDWQSVMRQINNEFGGEILGSNPSMEAKWAAQDLCITTGYLFALGADDMIAGDWRMLIGGRMALTAGEVVISDLSGLEQEVSKILKIRPPAGLGLEEYIIQACNMTDENPLGNLTDLIGEEILYLRLNSWAAGLAIRQSKNLDPISSEARKLIKDLGRRIGKRLNLENDPGGQFVSFLASLERAEAAADAILGDPIIKIWLQEDIEMMKKTSLVREIMEAKVADLPKVFQ